MQIVNELSFTLNHPADPQKPPDTSGDYPLPCHNVFKVVNPANAEIPVTLIVFGGVSPSVGNLVYTPFYAALWNPLLQHGETIIRPAMLVEDVTGAEALIEGGGLYIHEMGSEPRQMTFENGVCLRSLRTGDFAKFRIGIHPKPEFFPKPFITLSLHFTTSYILDGAPVYTPQEYGTRQYFPAYFGGLPTRMRFEDCPITVQIMLK